MTYVICQSILKGLVNFFLWFSYYTIYISTVIKRSNINQREKYHKWINELYKDYLQKYLHNGYKQIICTIS